jgi:hypothetical protein
MMRLNHSFPRRILAIGAAAVAAYALAAEDLRVQVAGDLASDGQEAARMVYAEGAVVRLPEDLEFVDGIELDLKIPKAAQAIKGAFLLIVYKRVSPVPDKSNVSYQAERVSMQVIPARVSQVYQVPIRADHGIKASPYSIILPLVQPKDFPIVVRLMPAVKGISEELEKAAFGLSARQIPREEASLELSYAWGEGLGQDTPVSVWIDDREQPGPGQAFILKPGNHTLRVSGSAVRDEFRSFTLVRGQRLALEIALEDVTPRLILEYPERTQVELDGKRLSQDQGVPAAISPGEHVIAFLVGDYTIQRKLTVKRGKTYRVSLAIDARVEEED